MELKYSEAGLWGIGAMAAATLALIAFTPGDAALRILAATWTSCIALHAADRMRRPRAIDLALVRDGSFVAPWLTVVRWRPPGARFDRATIVLPEMLSGEEFRELRVRLRWA
jgi:hypothetical protein